MGHTVRKFLGRPAADRRLLLHALALHLAIVALLRAVSHGRLMRWLGTVYGRSPAVPVPATDAIDAGRIAWAARTVAAQMRAGDACLPEALTALCLLRRGGHAAALRIGVTRVEGAPAPISAHAWLEHAGRIIVGGAAAPAYRTLQPPGALRGRR
jgi:hypothetical protein